MESHDEDTYLTMKYVDIGREEMWFQKKSTWCVVIRRKFKFFVQSSQVL